MLDRAFADNTSSWELDADGAGTRRSPDGDQEPRNLQREMMELHPARSESGPLRPPERRGCRARTLC